MDFLKFLFCLAPLAFSRFGLLPSDTSRHLFRPARRTVVQLCRVLPRTFGDEPLTKATDIIAASVSYPDVGIRNVATHDDLPVPVPFFTNPTKHLRPSLTATPKTRKQPRHCRIGLALMVKHPAVLATMVFPGMPFATGQTLCDATEHRQLSCLLLRLPVFPLLHLLHLPWMNHKLHSAVVAKEHLRTAAFRSSPPGTFAFARVGFIKKYAVPRFNATHRSAPCCCSAIHLSSASLSRR